MPLNPMTPGFALNLTHSGISLLHRKDQEWHEIGQAQLDDPNLNETLAEMRATAIKLEPNGLQCQLILPNSQVLYMEADAADIQADRAAEQQHITEALDGKTPYLLAELAYDWQRRDGMFYIAAIAHETLAEAEAFADEHQFNPVCFVAHPEVSNGFMGEVFFGDTKCAATIDSTPPEPTAPVVAVPVVTASVVTASVVTASVVSASAVAAPTAATPAATAQPDLQPQTDQTRADQTLSDQTQANQIPTPLESAATLVGADAKPKLPIQAIAGAAVGAIGIGVLAAFWLTQTSQIDSPLPAVADPETAQQETHEPAAIAQVPVTTPTETPDATTPDATTPAIIVPSYEDAEEFYAENNIWILSPDVGQYEDPTTQTPNQPDAFASGQFGQRELYVPSHDAVVSSSDALALPLLNTGTSGRSLPSILDPAPAGETFAVNAIGLVIPTPEGTQTPEGVQIFAGRPDYLIPPRPTDAETTPDTETAESAPEETVTDEDTIDLSSFQPTLRPNNLIETHERNIYGGLTRSELAARKPELRPESAQSAPDVDVTPTEYAVATSVVPSPRPNDFDAIVAAAQAASSTSRDTASSSASSSSSSRPRAAAPAIPTRASVARQATISNAIHLRRLSLVGVYKTSGSRRALMRTRSGRYVRVEVGDTIAGGRIAAIGDNSLQYVKGGRNTTMEVPRN